MQERDFIQWIRNQQLKFPDHVTIGIGDDTALLKFPNQEVLATVDMLMDGTHFILAQTDPRRIGAKALAVNLSDIAAMGGKPTTALVALALPRQHSSQLPTAIMEGIQDLANRWSVAVAGGDTNTWDGPLVISITVLGIPHAKGPVCRSGAKDQDVIYVTGPLGGSLEGHHLDFKPRIAEAKILLDHFDVHAMIDVSDGLATDLRHILQESGIAGAIIDKANIPLNPNIQSLAFDQAVGKALTDGEDFELCFTVSPTTAKALGRGESLGIPLYPIGHCSQGQQGILLRSANGHLTLLQSAGYEHRWHADDSNGAKKA